MSRKLTTEEFITRSNIVHKRKYNYDDVTYSGSHSKIIISCLNHGKFEQRADHHLRGVGCPKCGNIIKSTTKEFIEKSQKIHGDRYDYSITTYINNHTEVEILCKEHGIFKQQISVHLKGCGCNKCSGCNKLSTDEFIIKSNINHNNIYDYSLVEYKNNRSTVKIVCKYHGLFKQKASKHLGGQGCPKCKSSKGEVKISEILSKNRINFKSQYKINDLKDKKLLRFDFGIIDINNNLKCLIEYNGEQHYNYRGQFKLTKEEFISAQNRDRLKSDYCNHNNIKLFIIRYDEDINMRMLEIISEI